MNSEVIIVEFDVTLYDEKIRVLALTKIWKALAFKGLKTKVMNVNEEKRKFLFKICREEFQTVYDLLAEEFSCGREDTSSRSTEVG